LKLERWVEVVEVVVECGPYAGADEKKVPKEPRKKQDSMSQAESPTRLSDL
jgi:hypothetical protein